MTMMVSIHPEQSWVYPAWCRERLLASRLPAPPGKGPEIMAKRRAFWLEAKRRIESGSSTLDDERRHAKAAGLYAKSTYLKDIRPGPYGVVLEVPA